MFSVKWYYKSQSYKKPGTNKPWFTLRWITFKNNKAMSGDNVKNEIRKIMKKSKATLDNEYDVIYARAFKVGKFNNVRTEYSTCVKPFANTIFVIPKKNRKEARKAISELSVKGNFVVDD